MRYTDNGLEIDRMIIFAVIALVLLLALASGGNEQTPSNISGSYNTHYETHTTNIDICGVCVELNK